MTYSKRVADLRAILKDGGRTIGSWMQIADDSVAEIMGSAGFDWIALDLEHGRIGEEKYSGLFRAIEAGGALPFARVGQVSAYAIKAALDGGCQGVIVPMIETPDALREAIGWAHYPPRGTRGVGYSRANLFGKKFDEYWSHINPLVIAQIEHVRAVEAIDDILSVPGLDAIMIGPYDLSASMELAGQFDHPKFQMALDKILQASRRAGVASGLHVVKPEPARLDDAIDAGHRFIAYGVDAVFLWNSARVPKLKSNQ